MCRTLPENVVCQELLYSGAKIILSLLFGQLWYASDFGKFKTILEKCFKKLREI